MTRLAVIDRTDPRVAAYCEAIAADQGRLEAWRRGAAPCAAEVVAASERDDGRGTPASWHRSFLTRRSVRKGLDLFKFEQTHDVPIGYRDTGCPDAETVDHVGLARTVHGLAREARARGAAAKSALSRAEPVAPPGGRGGWRADWAYPDAPTDDPRAGAVWGYFVALDRLVSCARKIPDPVFRDDQLRLPLMEAVYYSGSPAALLAPGAGGPIGPAAQSLNAALTLLGEVEVLTASYASSLERRVQATPGARAVQWAVRGSALLALALGARAAWRWSARRG